MNSKYVDISNFPIKAKDWVELLDREDVHQLQIEELILDNNEVREFRATVISSSSNVHKPQSTLNIVLYKGVPTYGTVTPRVVTDVRKDNDPAYANFNVEKYIIMELKKFLDARIMHNFGAPFKIVKKYLINANILKGMSEEQAGKYLSRLLAKNKDLFKSTGGVIFSLKSSFDKAPDFNIGKSSSELKVVDFNKLVLGIRYLLESGLLGQVKIVNLPE